MGTIITIGREFGSGGREFGRRLAEELGFEYYDKEIVTRIAEHTSLFEEYVKKILKSTPHNLYPITIGHSFAYVDNVMFKNTQSVYAAQKEIIKNLSQKSDCVIVGRCADYILKDEKPFRIFVHADIDSRIARCRSRSDKAESFDDRQLKKMIKRIDRNRKAYYEFYTGHKWGHISNYDICVNTTNTDIKEVVKAISKMFK